MNLLVDTHVWLWWRTAPDKLSRKARAALEDDDNVLWFSAACAWEIATKHSLGKLPLPTDPGEFARDVVRTSSARSLAIDVAHAVRAGSLPRHHRDPFDRLLVAQAQVEKLVLVSNDELVTAYDVTVLWR